jgi:S1-C subfamily serine protease
MKKLSIIFMFVFSVLVLASIPDTEKFLNTVIMIQSADKTATGTGFIVQSKEINKDLYFNTIFSVEHIFMKPMYANILNNEDGFIDVKESRALQIIYKNSEDDLAMACFLSNQRMQLADVDYTTYPKLHGKVFSIGCGLGIPLRYSEGIVTGLSKSKKDYQHIQTSVYTVPGDSGCPLFYENKVIGIISSIRSYQNDGQTLAANNISMSKPIMLLDKLLKTSKYSFIRNHEEKIPLLLQDWMWLMDSELKFN